MNTQLNTAHIADLYSRSHGHTPSDWRVVTNRQWPRLLAKFRRTLLEAHEIVSGKTFQRKFMGEAVVMTLAIVPWVLILLFTH